MAPEKHVEKGRFISRGVNFFRTSYRLSNRWLAQSIIHQTSQDIKSRGRRLRFDPSRPRRTHEFMCIHKIACSIIRFEAGNPTSRWRICSSPGFRAQERSPIRVTRFSQCEKRRQGTICKAVAKNQAKGSKPVQISKYESFVVGANRQGINICGRHSRQNGIATLVYAVRP